MQSENERFVVTEKTAIRQPLHVAIDGPLLTNGLRGLRGGEVSRG